MAKKVILKDVATLLNGRAYKQDELLDSGKYPVLRVGNFFSNRGWFYSDLELEDDKYCDNGDLLFAWSASFGPKIWDGGKVIFHYHIWKILTTPQIDKKYFYYFLENAADRIKESGHGIAMIHTTKSEMEQMELLLPEMEQQLQIATVLDKVSELIALRKEQLAKLDELVKARFVEMFGDAVSNEKGWPLATLAEIAEIKIGPFGSLLHKEDYKTGGHALINPSHIIGGRIVIDDNLTIDDAKYAELSAYHLYPGDIVMGRRGEMGRCAVVYQNGLLCGTGSLIIRPNERMKPYFLQSILSSPTYKKVIEDKAVGVTMMNLNVPIVSELTVPLLPVDLQERFVEFMAKIDETKLTIQSSLDKLVVMKKALMQEYFG